MMAERKAVNERHEVYNKISRVNEKSKKQDDTRKKKKLDDTKTAFSGSEKSESEFEKKEKADARAQEPAPSNASVTPGRVPGQTPRRNRWDYAPGDEVMGRGAGGETPTPGRWVDPTPLRMGETPTPRRMGGRSKWDELPSAGPATGGAPGSTTPLYGTPRDPGLMTPTPEVSTHKLQMWRIENEIDEKNKALTDEELDKLLPTQGYEVTIDSIASVLMLGRS